MDWRITDAIIPTAVAFAGVLLIGLWIGNRPPEFAMRTPGLDRTESATETTLVRLPPKPGTPVRGDGTPSKIAGSWPCFRGPHHDGIDTESTKLARQWPASGPPQLWHLKLGEGYAGAAIGDGRVFVLDYDEQEQADTMRCLSLDDGREIWHNGYPVELTRNHGISRTVPAIAGDSVVSIGPRCDVACWNLATGECRWLINMVQQFGTEVPRWYTGQCPLVDGEQVVLAPGGKSLLAAVDLKSGKILWATPNPHGWEMTHASIATMEHLGRKMYVYCATGGVVGVAADDGAILWECTEWTTQFATAPSPVVVPDGRLFLSSGYGSKVGSIMLQVQPVAGGMQAVVLFSLTPKQFNSEQQTPIYFDGHVYGIHKHGGGQLVCLDLDGKELWNSGRDRFEHGPYLIADGVILALSGDGKLVMAEAVPDAYRPLAQHQVFEDGQDAWGPMALVAGRLVCRDMTRMTCLDLTQPQSQATNP